MRLMPDVTSIVELVGHRAAMQPDSVAYTFLESGEHAGAQFTWAALDRRCRAIGAAIAARVPKDSRVLVMYPPGLDFVAGFFGCLYGGAIAVPTYPPSGGRVDRTVARLRGMIRDAGITLILGPSSHSVRLPQLTILVPELAGLPFLAADEIPDDRAEGWRGPAHVRNGIAFLQYTSGSTATPRGVMVTHANLLHNLAASAALARHDDESVSVSWLPVNHDMGLIEGVLQPAYSGFPAYLMSPAAFLQRPARWLQAISRLRATHSGGPNFAYDLAVRRVRPCDRAALDLSCWRVAFNGSEPVRKETLEVFQRTFGECGFRWEAFKPAYGLAESTLLVTSRLRGETPLCIDVDKQALAAGRVVVRTPGGGERRTVSLVASGSPAPDAGIVIVDPERRVRCSPDCVGEIWVSGPSVARGYWRQPKETARTFQAFLGNGEGPYLRTGDLGFVHDDQLFVTGRIKDVLIVRGLKHYPQDLELTAERASAVLRPGCCAAIAVECGGEERAAIVAEIDAVEAAPDANALSGTIAAIRRAIADVHQIAPCAVVLVPAGSLPKTTSGKLQRYVCRDLFLSSELPSSAEWLDADLTEELERVAS
jgi:acyl-CoA synthetase (AMP-forming)/AMP-acid ligase II